MHSPAYACQGIVYSPEFYGPAGVDGGSMCFLKWRMPVGLGGPDDKFDSAQLVRQPNPNQTVCRNLRVC